ncbi:hypothetical protein A4G28_20050 [Mycobacterium ostraviense]|uniref:Uncharacterized protein n=1 Tax=Mycobacterium ostraviense TaxID=2738409 RepID=A0A163XKA4_9MYCO|nr:hypothetical protein A4G28_20050 [Mycobacterium ostraviense]
MAVPSTPIRCTCPNEARNLMAGAYPARVVENSRSPIAAPVMVTAATWMVSARVSAPATMSVDSAKMVVPLLTER